MADVVPIPFTESAGWVRVRMSGSFYTLLFRWNTRDEYWALTLQTASGRPLFEGMRIATGLNYLRQFVSKEMPRGILTLVDTTGVSADPGRLDLANGRHQLVFVEEADAA
jgi:hypothetical protein